MLTVELCHLVSICLLHKGSNCVKLATSTCRNSHIRYLAVLTSWLWRRICRQNMGWKLLTRCHIIESVVFLVVLLIAVTVRIALQSTRHLRLLIYLLAAGIDLNLLP